jgi:lipoprotein-anchoring transpeptidase ErfK/SrfK
VGRSFRGLLVVCALALVAAAPAGAQEPPEPVIADGVTIAGVAVGGLTAAEATDAVRAFFLRPVRVVLRGQTVAVRPSRLGAGARVGEAITAALAAAPDTALTLGVSIRAAGLRAWVKRRAKLYKRAPIPARVTLKGVTPRILAPKPGRALDAATARARLRAALLAHVRTVHLRVRTLKSSITPRKVGPAIVIRRGSRRLVLFRGTKAGRMHAATSFPVAVGMSAYPTPLGSFSIRVKTRNPWWYPPDAPWAEGAQPVPPGPGNPLGTRWMGLGGGVGIHGTYNSGSIGSAASHGCIRMHISSSEWLFERVRIGTRVFIVSA